jgi:hypothetical protein
VISVDILSAAVLLGIPANAMAIIAAFWLIDRRLVKIETMMHVLAKGEARTFSPCPADRE